MNKASAFRPGSFFLLISMMKMYRDMDDEVTVQQIDQLVNELF